MISRIKNKLSILYNRIRSQIALKSKQPPEVLSIEDTITLLKMDKCSISRNGDGEFDLMMGKSIPFQTYDRRLSNLLKEAISYESNGYISAIPDIFHGYSQFNKEASKYYDNYLRMKRWKIYKYAKLEKYGNTFISRFYIDYKDKSKADFRINLLKSIWKDEDVILIEGAESKLGVNNDLFKDTKSLMRIIAPSKNAFDRFDNIIDFVMANFNKDYLILLALGPTATAMAYVLSKKGYWAVDIGHIDIEYEWMLMGAKSKVPVLGKYTNEFPGDNKVIGNLPTEAIKKYNNEIIKEFV